MDLVDRVKLPGTIQAITVSPVGDRIAVLAAAAKSEGESSGPPQRGTLQLFRMSDGRLSTDATLVHLGLRHSEQGGDEGRVRNAQALFGSGRSLIVALAVASLGDERIEVLKVDLEAGEQTGLALDIPYPDHVSGLIPGPPTHLLLGTMNTVVCLDAESLEEVGRARQLNEDGEPQEEDAIPEEHIAAGGFAYDAARNRLLVFTGCYNMGIVSEYALRDSGSRFERRSRRDIVATRPKMGIDLTTVGGLALSPDGSSLAAMFQLEDLTLDASGRPVNDYADLRAYALDRHPTDGLSVPDVARIGWLALLGGESDTWIEILSDSQRDLEGGPWYENNAAGEACPVAFRACTTAPWEPQPVFVDDRHVAIASPTGILQLLDVTTGAATVEHDFAGPISCLSLWPEQRCLLLGGKDGTLTAVAIDGAGASTTWQGAREPAPIQ